MLRVVRALVLVAVLVARVEAQPSVPDPSPPAVPASPPSASSPAPNAPGGTSAAHGEHTYSADDETIAPSEIPVDLPPPPPGYPRSVVDRPLLLPSGRAEGRVRVGLGREAHDGASLTVAEVGVHGRLGLGPFQPYLGAGFAPFHSGTPGIEVPTFQNAYVGTWLAIARETAVAAEGGVADVGSDVQGYWSALAIEHRFHPSKRVAVLLGAVGEYGRRQQPTGYGPNGRTYEWVTAAADSTVQLQLTPLIALEAFGSIAQHAFVDDFHSSNDKYYRLYSYGGDLVVSVSEKIDVVPSFSVTTVESRQGTIGTLSLTVH